VISPSDPSSAWTAKANKRVQFGYGLNYLIDIDNAVIIDVEATPARTYDEVAATKTMLDRAEACFDLKPQRLAADTAYGTGEFLGWLVKEKKIAPHIPVWERPKREDGQFSSSDFRWDGRRGVYICPNGKQLRTSGTVHSDGRQRYRARKRDCDACTLRAQCGTKNEPHHIARDVHEDARDVARRKMKTKAFLKSRDQRKRVEMRFAHLKTHHGFERLRLRGLLNQRFFLALAHGVASFDKISAFFNSRKHRNVMRAGQRVERRVRQPSGNGVHACRHPFAILSRGIG
jgi:Transposase DDE domain